MTLVLGQQRVLRALTAYASSLAALMVLLMSSAPTRAAAQSRALDVQRFVPALDANGFLGVPGSATPGPMRTSFGVFIDYANAPLELKLPSGAERDAVQHRIGGSMSAELGLGTRAAIAARVPAVLFQSGEAVTPGDRDLAVIALSDPWLSARYRFIGEANEDPLMPKDGPGVALELHGRLPVGGDTAYAGEGTTRLGARLIFDIQLLGAGLGGMIGYEQRVHPRHVEGAKLTGELQLGAAVKLPLPSLHPLSAVLELRGASDFRSKQAGALEGEIGVRASLGELVLSLAGGAGLVGSIGAPDARVMFGLWYAPLPSDGDHDGVDDDEDKCPPLAEDPDGFEDADGCPDPDNDNDLIPDIDDLCPAVEALEGQDDDEDGCTDMPAKP